MSNEHMAQLATHRYTITVPDNLAKLIEKVCAQEGRNRSELFREAFRVYLSTRTHTANSAPRKEDPFRLFWPEWSSKNDQAYDRLAVESEKDRLLEQWAQMVETAPGFEDVRAVSGNVNAIAGESIA
jgi:hypothetical protein